MSLRRPEHPVREGAASTIPGDAPARLKTSRSQVDRILDPKRDITLSSLQRAAALVGQRVVLELV